MSPQKLYTQSEVIELIDQFARIALGQLGAPAHLDNGIEETAISQAQEEHDMALERRRVIIATNDDGTPVYKNLRANTQDEMNDKIVLSFIESGRIWEFMPRQQQAGPPRKQVLMRDFATQWLTRKRKAKPTTMVNYRIYVNNYIVPVLGDMDIAAISAMDVQRMLDHFSDKSKKTLTEVRAVLKQIFTYAISDKLITDNPCDSVDIEIPSDRETQREALPIEDYRDIMANFGKLLPEDQMYLALFMYTGMRRGEVLGLRWEDLDFDAMEIHVSRNAVYPGQNKAVITTPKTKAGVRTIPIDPDLAALLRPHRGDGYIFGGDEPLTSTGFKSIHRRIKRTIDMHGATPHVLRHSYLTYAVGETSDYKTVQGISGHADVFTLMNRYAHPQECKVKKLSENMHQIFTNVSKCATPQTLVAQGLNTP